MCLAVPVFARCRESLSCVPMLPHRRAQKRGCGVALSDLRFLLLLPAFPPMSGHGTDRHGTSGAVENSRPFANGRPTAARPTEEIVSTSVGRGAEGWSGQTAEPSGTPERCSSSEDCSKEKQEESLSLNSGTDSGVRTPLCRICFQGPEQGVLLSPCRCSGSVRCTHEVCLIKWISERGSWSCELCYYKYQVSAISTKNPLQWQAISLTMIERVQIAAAVLGSLFLLASVSWLIWSSLSPSAKWQRQDLLFQICYAMYGFMDLVCVALIVHEGPSVFRIFHRWQAVNQQWKVLNYDKVKDHEDHQKSGVIFRTLSLSLTSRGGTQVAPGTDSSPSTSSFMAAATATTAVPAATDVEVEPRDSPMPDQQQSGSGLMHLLSQLRGAEPWGAEPQGPCGRELVMRVTTV